MTQDILDKLAALIRQERDALLAQWRLEVRALPSARDLDVPTLNDHLPGLFDELAEALEAGSQQTIPEALHGRGPAVHGKQRLEHRFDIEEVVAEYNILRGCIHDFADSNGLSLQGRPFHIVNRVLDGAIGLALETYSTQRALEVQRRREEYLSFVAHDLRTPLNAISLAGRVLEMTVEQARPEIILMLKTLQRNVQQLEALVDKVLEESTSFQTEVGVRLERREFYLWPLVEALIYDLHPVAGTSSTRLVNGVPDDLVVFADAGLLRRVFQNLIANAIKYTPRGQVDIGARKLDSEAVVECTVSDDGTGIPPELVDRVFDKGASDPANEDGLGLGLAIVKTFTEAHGGSVVVASSPGAGTTFRILLPSRPDVEASARH